MISKVHVFPTKTLLDTFWHHGIAGPGFSRSNANTSDPWLVDFIGFDPDMTDGSVAYSPSEVGFAPCHLTEVWINLHIDDSAYHSFLFSKMLNFDFWDICVSGRNSWRSEIFRRFHEPRSVAGLAKSNKWRRVSMILAWKLARC